MIRKILSISVALAASISMAFGQAGQGALKGKVIDKASKEPLPFVNVIVEMNGNQVTGAATDFDGAFMIKPLSPGVYDVKATFTGYQPIKITGVVVKSDKITFQDLAMATTAIDITEFEVISYSVPLIDKDNTASGGTVTREDIDKLPGRSATAVAQTVGGVYSKDDGSGDLSIRGSRSDASYYFIDGVKVRGSSSLPKAAIEQVSVVTGGVPAQYGDLTGGVISITTRGASAEYFGSLDYLTSGYKIGDKMYGLDPYGYNLLEFSVGGPLLMKKDSTGNKTKPLLAFMLSGNGTSIVDPMPSALGVWRLKEDKQKEVTENPLRFSPNGSGTFLNHEYLRLSDFEKVKTRQNVTRNGANLNAKIDVTTTPNTRLTFGGSLDYSRRHDDNYRDGGSEAIANGNLVAWTLMNSHHLPLYTALDWRVYTRFTHSFGSEEGGDKDEKSASLIKNAFYSIQVDYNRNNRKNMDDVHKDNLFNYGYIGKFKTYQMPFYLPGNDSVTGMSGLIQQTFQDTLIAYESAGSINPEASAFTDAYYNLYGYDVANSTIDNPIYNSEQAGDAFINKVNIQNFGGLLNGDQPRSIYDMWRTPAYGYNSYGFSESNQFRVNAMGSADIKDHAIALGFEYEQRVDRGFSSSPRGLWTLGRQYVNSHLNNLDLNHPSIDWNLTMPTISYERMNAAPDSIWGGDYSASDPQYFFDYNLRKKLGYNPDGNDFVDFDSYGPETYALDMFSADELLNGGNALVTYYGYTPQGEKLTSDPTFDDFFTAKDEYGNYLRPIAPFRPIYIAGFIQDKFSFDDLVFNVGLRVDRFDANQQVLRDPYVLFPTVKADESEARALVENGQHPGIIENNPQDFVVYVDNIANPTKVVGYRRLEDNVWFNSEGSEIANAKVLETANGIAPLLVDKTDAKGQDVTSESFVDYKPQTNFMPRVSFSFPISDEAQFFAHYDVLTKRPTSGLRLDPTDYYFIEVMGGDPLNNPNLKPEKTIDYELGFTQKLNNFSAFTLSAFYRENRDMVQVVYLAQTYPVPNYITYGNRDFGTVKGLNVSYDLRRFGNIRARLAYTLQFAEGTGSDATGALNIVRSGNQNIRTTVPLAFDQRHQIALSMDYRYGGGKDYNGPVLMDKQIFADAGANFILNAGSGYPYSRQSNFTSEGLFSGGTSASLLGSVNGARLPWQFRVDATFDKDFDLKFGKDGEGEGAKKAKIYGANVYLQILNLLNAKNIINVYRATGNPDDDGYLGAAQFQKTIEQQNSELAFREMYMMKVNNGSMYSLPRRIQLGVRISF